MSDNEYEYIDEDGNPVDPATLGDHYEIVEEDVETPAPSTAVGSTPDDSAELPKLGRKGARVLAGVGVAVVAVLGGVVFGLAGIGQQNTVGDVRDAAAAKSSAVRDRVASKSSEVESKASEADPRSDWTACDHIHTATASAAGDDKYDSNMRLRLLSTAPMPANVASVVDRKDLATADLTILQLGKAEFGIYAPAPANRQANGRTELQRWLKATVTVKDNTIAVADAAETDGSDEDAAPTCKMLDDRPMYVEGDGPADAEDLRDGIAKVLRAKGSANGQLGIVIFDDPKLTVGLVELTYAEGGDGE